MPDRFLEEIRAALLAGRRIAAIQLYREHTDADLRESMEFIIALESQSRQECRNPIDGAQRTRLAGWAFAIFGVLFALFGMSEVVPSVIATSGIAGGRVVREEHNEGPVAVFEYQVNGNEYTCKQHHAVVRHRIGEEVRVVYKAADPNVACIDSFYDRWFVPLIFSGFGTFFASLGVRWVWKPPRRTAQ